MKNYQKALVFFSTLLISTSMFAKSQFPYSHSDLNVKYLNNRWQSIIPTNNVHGIPSGMTIQIGKSSSWIGENVLGNVEETHMGINIGLSQTFNTVDSKKNPIGFTGEDFKIGSIKLFRTTKDIKKSILPIKNYVKPITYKSQYYKNLNGYTMNMNDAKKIVENYISDGEVAKYYYKSMDIMRYEGECDKNGIRSGFGRMYNLDGELIYIGSWKDGVFDGYGITFYDDKASYIGGWKDGLPNGMGSLPTTRVNIPRIETHFYFNENKYLTYKSIEHIYPIGESPKFLIQHEIPFNNKKGISTISDLNMEKLISLCENYETGYKVWSDNRINEIKKAMEERPDINW